MNRHSIPRHVPGVRLREGRGATLLAPGGAVLKLDATALALWELCDGETTLEEMAQAASSVFDAPPETVEQDIARALDQLVAAGMLLTTQAPSAQSCP